MKKILVFRRLLMIALPLAITASALASVVPCPLFPTTAAISTLPSGSGNGCSSGNLQFTNFLVGTTTDTINGITLGPNATSFAVPTAATINTGVSSGTDIHFDTGAVPPCTNGSFCVSGKNQSLSSTISYEFSTIDLAASISSITLTGTLSSNAQGTPALFLEICPNATLFGQGCGGYQVAQLLTTGTTSLLFAGVNKVAVRETVYLTTKNGTGSDAAVTVDASAPATAPEPATLGSVGLALGGLGALRFCKRKL